MNFLENRLYYVMNKLDLDPGVDRQTIYLLSRPWSIITKPNVNLYNYACFIDLKKAFDYVWRTGLIYKLLKSGVSKKIVSGIKDLYEKN